MKHKRDKTKMIDTDPHKQRTPEAFGPTPEDAALYKELLTRLENGEKLGFDPMYTAESVAKNLDDAIQGEPGVLGFPIDPEEQTKESLDEEGALLLAQQRYIAATLGFKVGPNHFRDGTVEADVEYPDTAILPERPQRGDDGVFRRPDGTKISPVQVDAIYSAHFLANHPETFKQPGAFQAVFERIRKGAASGRVSINLDTFADDPRGAQSFIRQATRVMGYNVGDFKKNDDGVAEMVVDGTRSGFGTPSEKLVGDVDQEPPEELDRARLNELIEQSKQSGIYFGKGIELTDHDRRQFDVIATKVRAYLEPFYQQSDWKEFMKLVDEEDKKGVLISFANHEGTSVPSWCVDGGEDAEIKKVRREIEHRTSSAIQVPSNIFNIYHWKNTVEALERNYRDRSNATIKGQSPRQLGGILKGLALLVSQIEQGKH